jgi:hypothetical protein
MPLLDTYGMIVEHEALGIAWTWSDILRCMQGICPKGTIHLPTLRELKASCVGRDGWLHGMLYTLHWIYSNAWEQ